MGLDRFANFISKSINIDGIEELLINNNIRKIISNHIIFDINFLIYQEIIEIENEINDIIKILLCRSYSSSNIDILDEILNKIFKQNHWDKYNITSHLNMSIDNFEEDTIINNFISYIKKKIKFKFYNR